MRLQVEDLAYSYEEKDVVDQVSLQVERGEFVGLIGPNGSGKSTVLKNIYRGLTPDRGSIKLDGENLMTMPYKKSAVKMAVVGHEIGHVVHTDSKDAMKNAYLRSAVKNAAGAANDKVAKLTDSELGAMAEALAGAQFSQKQENEADDYGVEFCVKNGIDPYAMANALSKLAELAKDAPKASYAQRMFSSHPDTQKRIERTKAKADSYAKK